MERVAVAVALVAIALAIAWALERRRPDAPTQSRYSVPDQLDRADFERPDAAWLVALFTSATCDSCEKARAAVRVLASSAVVVQELEVGIRKDLHDRYAIDAVPTIVVADADGVVCAAFVGTPTATDLWAAVAEARDPGVSPEPGLGRPRSDAPG